MKILIALFAMALAYVPSTSVGADRVAQAGPVSPWECSNDMTAGEKNLADAGAMVRPLKDLDYLA